MTNRQTITSSISGGETSFGVFAVIAMLGWVLVEVSLRRGIVPVLSTSLGNALGTAMIVSAFGFVLLAAIIGWWGTRLGIGPTEWKYTPSIRSVATGFGGIVAYIIVFFGVVVIATLMGVGLPSNVSDVVGTTNAPLWALGALLVVNGLIVPIMEEFAWRGVIQTALMDSYGTVLGGLITAAAFVLKHIIVDAGEPWFRLVSLIVLALILSGLRVRYGTTSSTVAHIGVNSFSTASLVIAGL